jgi:hypothetical protein
LQLRVACPRISDNKKSVNHPRARSGGSTPANPLGSYFLASYFPRYVSERCEAEHDGATNLFGKMSVPRRGGKEVWVRETSRFLISLIMRRRRARSREYPAVSTIIARPEIKTQSRRLAEYRRRCRRAPRTSVCRKTKRLRQMRRVRMLLNSGPLAISGSSAARPFACSLARKRAPLRA